MKKIRLSKKLILLIVVVVVFVAMTIGFVANAVINHGFIRRVESDALTASVLIVTETITSLDENTTSISYSAGASGVIFRKEGNKYYVLTALHSVDTAIAQGDTIYVLGHDQLTYDKSDLSISFTVYYSQFAIGTVEYYDEKYDLAVLSFSSENVYVALSISGKEPKFGQRVASLSNPYRKERNAIRTGFCLRRRWIAFEEGGLDYFVVEHTAETSGGSSGGALLNEDMEVVGIIIGGAETEQGDYLVGYAIPSDSINQFLIDNGHTQ